MRLCDKFRLQELEGEGRIRDLFDQTLFQSSG